MLHGASYLRYGMMGADVLANLISAAHAKGLYVILGMGTEEPALWQSYGADAITVDPYMGSDCCDAGEQAVFALVRTCNKSGGEVQNLMAGDRPLYLAVAEQMARLWWWAAGTVWISGTCAACVPSPSCCCRSAMARTPSPPLMSTATALWPWILTCNSPRMRWRPWTAPSAR